jgi:Fe2+ or Zn2+ uptake regulation protein
MHVKAIYSIYIITIYNNLKLTHTDTGLTVYITENGGTFWHFSHHHDHDHKQV